MFSQVVIMSNLLFFFLFLSLTCSKVTLARKLRPEVCI